MTIDHRCSCVTARETGHGARPFHSNSLPSCERCAIDAPPVPRIPSSGLAGGRLQPKVLAEIVHRCAKRAQLSKKVTAHTLRHTAATWLRQGAADTRLVAEYLGHADLSTVARYAHVGDEELHAAVATLAHRAGL
jgi:integrase